MQLKTMAGIFLFLIETIIEISHKTGCIGMRYSSKGSPDNGVGKEPAAQKNQPTNAAANNTHLIMQSHLYMLYITIFITSGSNYSRGDEEIQ